MHLTLRRTFTAAAAVVVLGVILALLYLPSRTRDMSDLEATAPPEIVPALAD